MKRFSLTTLILLTVIAALSVSQIVMMRSLAEARAEVESVRAVYGYISVDDPSKTYVNSVPNVGMGSKVRIIVPAGSRYLLHLSDAKLDFETELETLPVTKSISLNSWREGADATLTYAVLKENGKPRIEVRSGDDLFFDYILEDWVDSGEPNEGSDIGLDGQREFAIDEDIGIMTWLDPGTGRGVAIWLEPHSRYVERKQKPN